MRVSRCNLLRRSATQRVLKLDRHVDAQGSMRGQDRRTAGWAPHGHGLTTLRSGTNIDRQRHPLLLGVSARRIVVCTARHRQGAGAAKGWQIHAFQPSCATRSPNEWSAMREGEGLLRWTACQRKWSTRAARPVPDLCVVTFGAPQVAANHGHTPQLRRGLTNILCSCVGQPESESVKAPIEAGTPCLTAFARPVVSVTTHRLTVRAHLYGSQCSCGGDLFTSSVPT